MFPRSENVDVNADCTWIYNFALVFLVQQKDQPMQKTLAEVISPPPLQDGGPGMCIVSHTYLIMMHLNNHELCLALSKDWIPLNKPLVLFSSLCCQWSLENRAGRIIHIVVQKWRSNYSQFRKKKDWSCWVVTVPLHWKLAFRKNILQHNASLLLGTVTKQI